MEYISSFTYCDSIQTEVTPQGARPQIVNPLQALTPFSVPGNYSFAIACNIAGFDIKKENIINIKFISPSGHVLNDTGDIKLQFPIEQTRIDKPGMMQFNLEMRNLVFMEIGVYSTEISVNHTKLGEYKIQVMVGGNDDIKTNAGY